MKLKWLKLTFYLLCVVVISYSCELLFHDDMDFYNHELQLSFQDTLGNDLVKGLVPDSGNYINNELYSLNIYFDGVLQNSKPGMSFIKNTSGHYHFRLCGNRHREDETSNVMITFRLNCPEVFGDLRDHFINTWWINYETCSRIEIDDKEIIPEEINSSIYEWKKAYYANITLNR